MNATVLEKEPAAPTRTPEETYRAAVFDAVEPDTKVLEAATRLPSDFCIDSATYAMRLKAQEQLAAGDAMKEEAARLEKEFEANTIGVQPVANYPTIAELHSVLDEYGKSKDLIVSEKKLAAHAKRQDIRLMRSTALQVLASTADPSIAEQVREKADRIESIRKARANRGELLQLEERIAETERDIEMLATGIRPEWFLSDQRDNETLRSAVKAYRAELLAQRPMAEKARVDNAAGEKEIARLESEIGKLNEKKLLPENMRWSE